jgi:hypothetical protein
VNARQTFRTHRSLRRTVLISFRVSDASTHINYHACTVHATSCYSATLNFTQYACPPCRSRAADRAPGRAACVRESREEARAGYECYHASERADLPARAHIAKEDLVPGPARHPQNQGAVAGGQPGGSCRWFTVPDEAKEDGAEETRAAIDGGMSEATSGFLEQATSSNIWVSMSRESAGFCFSKLSKASFSCAIAFCTCDTNSSRRGG